MIAELLDRIFPSRAAPRMDSGVSNPQDWFVESVTYGESDTGLYVDGYTILRSGPVWQAVNTIAGDIGRLTLLVEKSNGEADKRHPAYKLLTRKPNERHLAITFKELLESWALLWGNGCAKIMRNNRGEPTQLIPMRPDRVQPVDVSGMPGVGPGDALSIQYTWADGKVSLWPYEDVLHIVGLGDDTWGYTVWDLAQNSVGHNLALQKHGNRQFKNSARPSGVLEKDGRMSPEGRSNLRREWNEIHQGLDNAGRIALLQEGVKFKATQVANGDAQWVEGRRFSREEIAAWFNLPPHKLGAMENASVRSNLEEQNRDYWNSSLSRWAAKWEQECEKKLLSKVQQDNGSHQVRFELGDLIRGDIKTRFVAYSQGRQWSWLSVNEIRVKENMSPIGPDGDTYLTPTNMTDDPSGAPAGAAEPVAPEPTEDEGNDTAVRDRCRHLVEERLAEMMAIETERLTKIAARGNVANLLDQFYDMWPKRVLSQLASVVDVAAAAGGVCPTWPDVVLTYCAASKGEVEGILKTSAPTAAAEQITLLIGSWDERRRDLANQIMEDVQRR